MQESTNITPPLHTNVGKKQAYFYPTISPTQLTGLADVILEKVFGFDALPDMVTLAANQQGHFHFKAQFMYEDSIPFPQKRETASKEKEKQQVKDIALAFFRTANEKVKANKQPKLENQDGIRPMFRDRDVDRGAFPSDFPDLFPIQYLEWQSTEPIFHPEYPKNIHYYEVRFRVELPVIPEQKQIPIERPSLSMVSSATSAPISANQRAAKATVQNEYIVLHINPNDKRYEIMGVESHFVQIAGQELTDLLEKAGENAGLYFLQEGNLKVPYWVADRKMAASKLKNDTSLIENGETNPLFYRHPMDEKGIYVYDLDGNFRFWVPYTRNEIHYVEEEEILTLIVSLNMKSMVRKTWESIKSEFRGEDKYFYANQVRRYSVCFIGANTFAAFSEILKMFYDDPPVNNTENRKNETGGLMYISESRELLPYEFRDKNNRRAEASIAENGIPSVDLGKFMQDADNRARLHKEKKHFFCKWHSHPDSGGHIPSGRWVYNKEELKEENIKKTETLINETHSDSNVILDNIENYSIDKKHYRELPCLLFNSYRDTALGDENVLTIYRSNKKTINDKIQDFAKIYSQAPIWGGVEDNPSDIEEHRRKYNVATKPKSIEIISAWWQSNEEFVYLWLAVKGTFFN